MRILFIGHTRIGDAVLSFGLVDHLARSAPGARITVACGALPAPLFVRAPGVERVLPIVKRPRGLHWPALWRAVVGTHWDLVVDLRRSAIPYLVRPRRRARLPAAALADEHRVVQIARTLGLGDAPPAPRLWTNATDEAAAACLLPPGPPLLGIGPTANWRGKTWRAERFAELVARLTGPRGPLPGGRVAVFGAPAERAAAAPVLDAIPASRRVDLVGAVELPVVAACFARLALYVGNDSGLMHMAAAAGAPTLGLFGPSRTEHYAPWGPRAAWVGTSLGYDDLVGGPGYDHRATDTLMDSLTVDAAEAATLSLWRRIRGEAA
ncbi:MAG: glycosyltransferase family 9 protein [Alphaproteobacteria bacterium]|nr:glycosyltransferase family 9 protein [Alphaproteobacteria bacterium]